MCIITSGHMTKAKVGSQVFMEAVINHLWAHTRDLAVHLIQ
jgi:hypothetical protein